MKDRPLAVRINDIRTGHPVSLTTQALFQYDMDSIPEWIKVKELTIDKEQAEWIICNDKEHLLLCVERGCLEFYPFFSRTNQLHSADYSVILIDSPEGSSAKAIEVALTLKTILDGL